MTFGGSVRLGAANKQFVYVGWFTADLIAYAIGQNNIVICIH